MPFQNTISGNRPAAALRRGIPGRTTLAVAATTLLGLLSTPSLRGQPADLEQPEQIAVQSALDRQRESIRGQREQLARMSELRRLMAASIERQRNSVRRQVEAARPPAAEPPPAQVWAAHQPSCAPIPFLEIEPYINQVARREGLTTDLLRAVIGRESSFQPCAVSHKGAMGMMQLMPATAAELGVKNPFDPHENIDGGARYLNYLLNRFGGDLKLALAGYNAGPHRVVRHQGVPPFQETQDYIVDIMEELRLPELLRDDD